MSPAVSSIRRTRRPAAEQSPEYIDFAAYRRGGYADRRCLAGKRTREEMTKIMEDSGLRGLGGAGFPTGRKWKIVAAEPGRA